MDIKHSSSPSTGALRILLVDGHRLFRTGVRKMLAEHAGFTIVGDVGSGQEALTEFGKHHPDVVVMEVRLPDGSGIEILRDLRGRGNETQVLFLTTVDDPEMLLAAAEAGAAGYILKDISPENLVNAILAVHDGRTMIHPLLARRMLNRLEAKARGTSAPQINGLKDAEISILKSVALGLSDREIAAKLLMSEATVKKRLRNIYGKLGARNRAQAALLAAQNRLI